MTLDTVTGEVLPARRDTFSILSDALRLADAISDTEMVPTVLRGRSDAILAVILAGYELGLGPMQSLQTIDLIQGRPALSPEGMRALVLGRGHTILVDASDDSCTLQCHRREWLPEAWTTHTFTMADAERAGLLGKDNWKRYPRAMLLARATSEACRAVFADIIAGISYTPEELDVPAANAPPSARRVIPAQGGDDDGPACAIDGAAELEARLTASPDAVRFAFRDWRKSKGYGWPPESPDVLKEMVDELAKVEAEAAVQYDTYGTG